MHSARNRLTLVRRLLGWWQPPILASDPSRQGLPVLASTITITLSKPKKNNTSALDFALRCRYSIVINVLIIRFCPKSVNIRRSVKSCSLYIRLDASNCILTQCDRRRFSRSCGWQALPRLFLFDYFIRLFFSFLYLFNLLAMQHCRCSHGGSTVRC